jgi:hypothetical protein
VGSDGLYNDTDYRPSRSRVIHGYTVADPYAYQPVTELMIRLGRRISAKANGVDLSFVTVLLVLSCALVAGGCRFQRAEKRPVVPSYRVLDMYSSGDASERVSGPRRSHQVLLLWFNPGVVKLSWYVLWRNH